MNIYNNCFNKEAYILKKKISLTYFVEENSPWSYGCVMQKGEIKVFAADKVPFT